MNNHTDLQPNRRLRDRMSGGVRGRGLATLSYPIKKHLTNLIKYDIIQVCGCVGMADEGDSKSLVGNNVWVQVPPPAPTRHTF